MLHTIEEVTRSGLWIVTALDALSDTEVRAVREGAARPAAELTADLGRRIEQLSDIAASMPTERWDTLVTALAGWRHPPGTRSTVVGASSKPTTSTWTSATARTTGPART